MGPGRVGSSLTEADSTRIKGNGSKSYLAGLVVGIQTSLDLDFVSSDS